MPTTSTTLRNVIIIIPASLAKFLIGQYGISIPMVAAMYPIATITTLINNSFQFNFFITLIFC